MAFHIHIPMNESLYLRDPEGSELGRKILEHSVRLIRELGFEGFTFKKLAAEIQTKEASIYRYFENKHRLLVYLVAFYWAWRHTLLEYHTHNVASAKEKLDIALQVLSALKQEGLNLYAHLDMEALQEVVMAEEAKAYLTKHVGEDNKARFFSPLKELAKSLAAIIQLNAPAFPFPHSLASTLIEASHQQIFFKRHLPSLTDLKGEDEQGQVFCFLQCIALSAISFKAE